MTDNETMTAEKGKGFTVFRGDTATLDNDKIRNTLYDIGKSLRPSIGRSWTTSSKMAKIFACTYAEGREYPTVPIVYHGTANKLKKGLFWDLEREVHIKSGGKSILKSIEIIDSKDCEKIIKELKEK